MNYSGGNNSTNSNGRTNSLNSNKIVNLQQNIILNYFGGNVDKKYEKKNRKVSGDSIDDNETVRLSMEDEAFMNKNEIIECVRFGNLNLADSDISDQNQKQQISDELQDLRFTTCKVIGQGKGKSDSDDGFEIIAQNDCGEQIKLDKKSNGKTSSFENLTDSPELNQNQKILQEVDQPYLTPPFLQEMMQKIEGSLGSNKQDDEVNACRDIEDLIVFFKKNAIYSSDYGEEQKQQYKPNVQQKKHQQRQGNQNQQARK